MNRIKSYYQLCKPNVVYMMLVTALVGILLASDTVPSVSLIFGSLLGIGLCAGSAAAVNQIIDRNVDASMKRTDKRPLPQGEISAANAAFFAFVIGLLGSLVLYFYINPLTMYLTLASLVGYAFIYTIYLKRATPQNIVIGGLAGAIPPLLGWTAVTGEIHAYPLLLVLIIFTWTPPHFWALAIHREKDYAKAKIPMLPVTHGVEYTKTFVLLYTVLLFLVCLLPYLAGMADLIYLVGSSALNTGFLYYAYKLKFNATEQTAMQTFKFSIIHLMVLFVVLLLDHYIPITV